MQIKKRNRDLTTIVFMVAIAAPAFGQQPKEIRITASEFSFKPAKIQASQGEVKIIVTNRGKFLHGPGHCGQRGKNEIHRTRRD